MPFNIFKLYKTAYSGLSKETWLLGFVVLVNRAGTMVLPFLSIYCTQQLHFSLQQAGFVMAIFGVGAIFGSQVTGKLVDKIGFYKIQIASLLLGGIMFFIVMQMQQFYFLCGSVFLMSFFNESFRPANSTAIVHYSKPENRTRSYAVNRLAINLGFAVGGAIGGWLASFNYQLLFWVDGCSNIIAALLMIKILKPVVHIGKNKNKEINKKSDSPFSDKVFIFFILITFTFSLCFMQLFGTQPLFLKNDWHFSEKQIGVLMAINGLLIVAIEMVLIHQLEGKKNALYYIRIGIVILGMGFGLYLFKQGSFLVGIISMILITFGEIFCLPFFNSFWTHRTTEFNRGRYAALYSTAWGAAHVTAPTLGTFLAAKFGFSIFWAIIVGLLICLFFVILFFEKNI